MDSAGNLYGTTLTGGSRVKSCAESCGTIFEFSAKGVLSTLYSFTAGSDGNAPCCLVMSSSGDLYGFTYYGGLGSGTVFKFATKTKKFTTLHEFGSVANDGAHPIGLLVLDSAGDLYGVTSDGGINGNGTIFEVTPQGVETIFYSFTSVTRYPLTNVVQGNKGDFYGVSYNGQLFEVTSGGVLSILNTGLDLGQDDPVSQGYIARSTAGNIYGEFYYTIYSGGNSTFYAGLWEVDGSNDTLSQYDFLDGCITDCTAPEPDAPLLLSGDNIYGTSLGDGASYEGAVFEFDESTGIETTLYSFCPNLPNCTDGANPEWNVVADSEGNLYGTTSYGGEYGFGTIFKLTEN
jgi:uncharacterized repeat protein (TIGR03803 family)